MGRIFWANPAAALDGQYVKRIMPAIRHDTVVARHLNRWYKLVAVATVICLYFAVKDLFSEAMVDVWGPLLCLAPLLAICYVGKHRILSGFKCRDCGKPLPLPRRERGKTFEARYYCQHCNIVWETGVKESDDSSA